LISPLKQHLTFIGELFMDTDLAEAVFSSLTSGVRPGSGIDIKRELFKLEISKTLESLLHTGRKANTAFSKTVTKIVGLIGPERAQIISDSIVHLKVPASGDQAAEAEMLFCAACQRSFNKIHAFESHKSGKKHQQAEISLEQTELLSPKGGLSLRRISPAEDTIQVPTNRKVEIEIHISNDGKAPRQIERLYNAINSTEFQILCAAPFSIKSGQTLAITATFSSRYFGTYNAVVIAACKGFKIGHHICCDVVDQDLQYLAASSPFQGKERRRDITKGAKIIAAEDEPRRTFAPRFGLFNLKLASDPRQFLPIQKCRFQGQIENISRSKGAQRRACGRRSGSYKTPRFKRAWTSTDLAIFAMARRDPNGA
jgi:hypothetical protein